MLFDVVTLFAMNPYLKPSYALLAFWVVAFVCGMNDGRGGRGRR